jgi:hypothetical protein
MQSEKTMIDLWMRNVSNRLINEFDWWKCNQNDLKDSKHAIRKGYDWLMNEESQHEINKQIWFDRWNIVSIIWIIDMNLNIYPEKAENIFNEDDQQRN